jgi:hypothetical protein
MFMRPVVVRRRPLLRAAAVGGTFAAGRAMGRRAEQQSYAQADQDQRISDLEAGQAQYQQGQYQQAQSQQMGGPPQQAAAPQQETQTSGSGYLLDQLTQLTAMHDQGALSDEEFASAKAKLLGG